MKKLVNDMKTLVQKHVLHTLNYRAMDKYINKHLGKDLVGVEIGVWGAGHAECMLHHLPIEKLYLVDPYVDYDDYPELKGLGDKTFQDAKYRLKQFDDKICWIRDMSDGVVDIIPFYLDFAYIDGNHQYDFVKRDIGLYYPKIRPGGILGGHDFSTCHVGVPSAVCEFALINNLELYGKDLDWWVVKPVSDQVGLKG